MSELPPDITCDDALLAPLLDYTESPEIIAQELRRQSDEAVSHLDQYLCESDEQVDHSVRHYPQAEVTALVASQLIDPSLPTIAVDSNNTYVGSELVALAAHESGIANVVFVPHGISFGDIVHYADGTSRLEVSHGWLLDKKGEIVSGVFTDPLPVDMVDSTKRPLLEQLADQGVATIQSLPTIDRWSDKARLPENIQTSCISTPPRHELGDMWRDDPSAEYVIKPARESQGRGVVMFDGVATRDSALGYHQFLREKGYDPLIQSRIRSYPMAHPQTGQRLDWNARALLAHGTVVDMYIRANTWNRPVNMAAGARELLLKDLVTYGVKPETVDVISSVLRSCAQAIAERHADIPFAGLDVVLDESLQPYVYELNLGNVGGLQTIARLTSGRQQKLAGAHVMLSALVPHVAKIDPVGPEISRQPVAPNWSDRANIITTQHAGRQLLRKLPLDVVYSLCGSGQQFSYWAEQEYKFRISKGIKTNDLDQALIEHDPLGIMMNPSKAIAGSTDPRKFMCDVMSARLPLDERERTLSAATVFAVEGLLKHSKQELDKIEQATDSEIEIIALGGVTTMAVALGYRELTDCHVDLIATYLKHGYDYAKVSAEYLVKNLTNVEHKNFVRHLHFDLAITNQDRETAVTLGRELLALNAHDPGVLYYLDLPDYVEVDYPALPELTICAQLAQHRVVDALVTFRRLIDSESPKASPDIVESITTLIGEGMSPQSESERRWLRQALKNWTSYVYKETDTWQIPVERPDSALADIITMFWAWERRELDVAGFFAKKAAEKLGITVEELDTITDLDY